MLRRALTTRRRPRPAGPRVPRASEPASGGTLASPPASGLTASPPNPWPPRPPRPPLWPDRSSAPSSWSPFSPPRRVACGASSAGPVLPNGRSSSSSGGSPGARRFRGGSLFLLTGRASGHPVARSRDTPLRGMAGPDQVARRRRRGACTAATARSSSTAPRSRRRSRRRSSGSSSPGSISPAAARRRSPKGRTSATLSSGRAAPWRRPRSRAAIPQDILERRKWQEYQSRLRTTTAEFEKARLEMESFAGRFEVRSRRPPHRPGQGRRGTSRPRRRSWRAWPSRRRGTASSSWAITGARGVSSRSATRPGRDRRSHRFPNLSDMEVIGWLSQSRRRTDRPGHARCDASSTPIPIATFTGKIEEVASIAEEGGQRTRGGFRARVSSRARIQQVMRPGDVGAHRDHPSNVGQGPDGPAPRRVTGRRDRASSTRTGASAPVQVRLAACTPIDCIVESGLSEGDRVLLRWSPRDHSP